MTDQFANIEGTRTKRRAGKYAAIVAAISLAAALVGVAISMHTSSDRQTDRSNGPYSLTKLLATVGSPSNLTPSEQQDLDNALSAVPVGQAMRSVLLSDGVSVVVDGTPVTIGYIALHTSGFDQSAIGTAIANAAEDGLNIQTAVSEVDTAAFGLKESVAYMILVSLLMHYAASESTVVSLAKAQAYAETEYQHYETHRGATYGGELPSGKTAKTAFLSTKAISGYQQDLTVTQEITAIAGPQSAAPTGNRTPVLVQWMKEQITSNSITIAGVAGLTATNVASYLPEGM